jgi:HPt (histidine-containing phosphotransfer) domain-containing protein
MSPAIQAKTTLMLAGMWDRNQPLIRQRLDTLNQAAEAASTGVSDPDLHHRAIDIAHKLAGSLGMFGFSRGTEIARELETELENHAAAPQRLKQLTADLSAAIFPDS